MGSWDQRVHQESPLLKGMIPFQGEDLFRDHLLRAHLWVFWRWNGHQNMIPKLCVCPLCIVQSCKTCSFPGCSHNEHLWFRRDSGSTASPLPPAFETLPNPRPRAVNTGEHSGSSAGVVLRIPAFLSIHRVGCTAVHRLSCSASSLDATQQLWEQPKPQECQGDYWPMSNLLCSRGPLSSGDRFTFLMALIELSKSALPAEGGLHSHQASSIIKKPHVFKIKLFLTVSLKDLLFWPTLWFLRFCQAVMTLTLFFETLSFSLSSSVHLLNWISSNEKRNRRYSKYTWGSNWCHFFLPCKTFAPHFNQQSRGNSYPK